MADLTRTLECFVNCLKLKCLLESRLKSGLPRFKKLVKGCLKHLNSSTQLFDAQNLYHIEFRVLHAILLSLSSTSASPAERAAIDLTAIAAATGLRPVELSNRSSDPASVLRKYIWCCAREREMYGKVGPPDDLSSGQIVVSPISHQRHIRPAVPAAYFLSDWPLLVFPSPASITTWRGAKAVRRGALSPFLPFLPFLFRVHLFACGLHVRSQKLIELDGGKGLILKSFLQNINPAQFDEWLRSIPYLGPEGIVFYGHCWKLYCKYLAMPPVPLVHPISCSRLC